MHIDLLKKEIERAFAGQPFDKHQPDTDCIQEYRPFIRHLTQITNGCAVLTDLAQKRSCLAIGSLSDFLGLDAAALSEEMLESLDEDCIYNRIHSDELYPKRLFELKYFYFLCNLAPEERMKYKATCRIRMLTSDQRYSYVSNQTQVLQNDSAGNIRLALCLYEIASDQSPACGIESRIINTCTGTVVPTALHGQTPVLSPREKEILGLIRDGWLSKEISRQLSISIHTVNRHRQNILQKLHASNAQEAIQYARTLGLLT